jgi:MSHA biogenesis protein MshM
MPIAYDIKIGIGYDVDLDLNTMANFLLAELERVGLAHATFSDDALALIVRASQGLLRRAKNLCLASLIETVRDRTRSVELKQVNRVLLQPHGREQPGAT